MSSSCPTRLRDSRTMVPRPTPCLATNISTKTPRLRRPHSPPTIPRASRISRNRDSKGLSRPPCPTGNHSNHRNTRRSTEPRSHHHRPTTLPKHTTPPPMPVRPHHSGSLHITATVPQTLAMGLRLRDHSVRPRMDNPPAQHPRLPFNNRPTHSPITAATPSLRRALRYLASVPKHQRLRTTQRNLWGHSLRTGVALGSSSIHKLLIPRRPRCRSGHTAMTVIRYTTGTRDRTRKRRP